MCVRRRQRQRDKRHVDKGMGESKSQMRGGTGYRGGKGVCVCERIERVGMIFCRL